MGNLGLILDWLLIFRRVRKLEAEVAALQADMAALKERLAGASLTI